MATTLATWTIDPVHSSVEFSLDYMGFSTYRTGFRNLEGSLYVPRDRDLAVAAQTPPLLLSPGPLVGYGIDAWGLPSVLSALGVLFSIVFVGLLLPLVLREAAPTMKEASL